MKKYFGFAKVLAMPSFVLANGQKIILRRIYECCIEVFNAEIIGLCFVKNWKQLKVLEVGKFEEALVTKNFLTGANENGQDLKFYEQGRPDCQKLCLVQSFKPYCAR